MGYMEERSEELLSLQNVYNASPSEIAIGLIEVPEVLRLNSISQTSGVSLSKFGLCNYKYTKLDHSVGIALILDKFVKDNREIITGFLHHIASPAFPEAVKLMRQEIEKLSNYDQVVGSDGLFEFVLNNKISINDVCDASIYPLITNANPKLSVVTLERLLHTAYYEKLCSIDEIKELYDDIVIVPNEESQPEFAFETPKNGVRFSKISMEIGKKFRSYEAKITLQIIADLLDMMLRRGELSSSDLYQFGDRAIQEIGVSSSDKQISDGWKELLKLDKVYTRFTEIQGEYCKKIITENGYVDPLVRIRGGYMRASKYDPILAREIEAYMNSDTDLYAYTLNLEYLK